MKRYAVLMPVIIVTILVDLAVELIVLPRIYSPIPFPYPITGKPIGAILLPATFLHLTLLTLSIIAIAYAADKAGFNVEGLLPRTRDGWIQTMFLMVLMISGLFLIWYPLALLPFIVSGIYLTFIEIK